MKIIWFDIKHECLQKRLQKSGKVIVLLFNKKVFLLLYFNMFVKESFRNIMIIKLLNFPTNAYFMLT